MSSPATIFPDGRSPRQQYRQKNKKTRYRLFLFPFLVGICSVSVVTILCLNTRFVVQQQQYLDLLRSPFSLSLSLSLSSPPSSFLSTKARTLLDNHNSRKSKSTSNSRIRSFSSSSSSSSDTSSLQPQIDDELLQRIPMLVLLWKSFFLSSESSSSSSSEEKNTPQSHHPLLIQPTIVKTFTNVLSIQLPTTTTATMSRQPKQSLLTVNSTTVPMQQSQNQNQNQHGFVTLTTHASATVDKLATLKQQLLRWNGPSSVAIYLSSIIDIDTFIEWFLESYDDFATVATTWTAAGVQGATEDDVLSPSIQFHFLIEVPPPSLSPLPTTPISSPPTSTSPSTQRHQQTLEYPHNRLRNIALDSTESDYFFAVDCDFIPNSNAFTIIQNLLMLPSLSPSSSSAAQVTSSKEQHQSPKSFKQRLDGGTLFVVPAFEKYQKYHVEDKTIPSTRQELLDMWLSPSPPSSSDESDTQSKPTTTTTKKKKKEQIVAPFHSVQYPQGHGPTKFEKWSAMTTLTPPPPLSSGTTSGINPPPYYYDIEYKAGFEPFVIGQKQSAPRYFEDFRGFGFNKISWLMEARAMGHDFAVVRDLFVIHINHPQHNVNPSKIGATAMLEFAKYLESSYGHVKELGVKDRIELANQILSGKFRPKGDLSWDGEFSPPSSSSSLRKKHSTSSNKNKLKKVPQKLSPPSLDVIASLTSKFDNVNKELDRS